VGSEVKGHITQLDAVSGKKRTLDALNADFTPSRTVQIEFDDLKPSSVSLPGLHPTAVLDWRFAKSDALLFRLPTVAPYYVGTNGGPCGLDRPNGFSLPHHRKAEKLKS